MINNKLSVAEDILWWRQIRRNSTISFNNNKGKIIEKRKNFFDQTGKILNKREGIEEDERKRENNLKNFKQTNKIK